MLLVGEKHKEIQHNLVFYTSFNYIYSIYPTFVIDWMDEPITNNGIGRNHTLDKIVVDLYFIQKKYMYCSY